MLASIDRGRASMLMLAVHQLREKESPRGGLHCSTIVRDIVQALEPKQELERGVTLLFQEIGNALETMFAIELMHSIPGWSKPEPRAHGGIIGSPDGYSPRADCIDEIKCAWKSSTDFLTLSDGDRGEVVSESLKFTGYKMQVLFYMKAFSASRARLHVLFVNGNYHPPFPDPWCIRLRPTPDEIERNYQMLRRHAQDRRWL